jgi:SAM-dependent methyltransferase
MIRPERGKPRPKIRAAARRAVRALAARLPANRQEPFLRLLRAARDVTTGRPDRTRAVSDHDRRYPDRFRVVPPPSPIPGEWPDAPVVENPDDCVRHFPSYPIYDGPLPHRFDIELFEQLNAEYESRPIWPSPPVYDTPSLMARTRKRLMEVHNVIDLANKRVLEIGCGSGYEVWYLSHHFGAEGYGVDVAERTGWKTLADDRTHFVWADITDENPLPAEFFDRIISFVVWEHVTHPYRALEEVYRMLKPGGITWLHANLYRGPVASHRYREITFPWPHLLFSDEVIKEFYRRRGLEERGAAWVNKLTWAQYARYFELIGFNVKMVKFAGRPFDEEFYERFENALNRYPMFDLKQDFFTAVLERPLNDL